jgi:hypothetical protein
MSSATDPFTAASPTYQAAIRHRHKSGECFEITGSRLNWGLILAIVLTGAFWIAVCLSMRPALELLVSVGGGA